jgi:hypothetical protein
MWIVWNVLLWISTSVEPAVVELVHPLLWNSTVVELAVTVKMLRNMLLRNADSVGLQLWNSAEVECCCLTG